MISDLKFCSFLGESFKSFFFVFFLFCYIIIGFTVIHIVFCLSSNGLNIEVTHFYMNLVSYCFEESNDGEEGNS